MPKDSVEIVENFWREVWQRPHNPDAIHDLVSTDFIITTGGRDITGQDDFKAWVTGFQALVDDFEFHIIETFQNAEGSRVASRWKITGRNQGMMNSERNGVPFEMTGTAVWEVGEDGLLRHNWVERNAFEVHGQITRGDHNVF